MKRRRSIGLTAVCAVGAVVLAACSSGSGSSGHTTGSPSGPAYGSAITSVLNSSTSKGGTITYDLSNVPDSTDPGNTYYAYMWNLTRLWATPLMTYKSVPGSGGLQVVPALATAPGTVSDNGLTWTYHIKPDVKFEDGTTVTSQDVKYAVERTFAKTVLPNGPSYFQLLLGGNAATYPGPYKDKSPNKMGLTAIDTPNATTIVFHLAKPFADMDYVVAIPQTAPVPPAKDTGANYQLHPVSTGPYMFQSYSLNKQFTLVDNPNWNPADDPQASQLAKTVVVNLNVNASDIDNRLLAGDIQMDLDGTGVQSAARAHILSSSSLMKNADDPISGFMWFFYLNTKVAPLNNVNCRQAIEYAANKVTLQDAYGGPVAGGDIASTAMPPNIIGYQKFDQYEALTKPTGDDAMAKQKLTACGQPNGFTTSIAYRSDRPKEVAAATALQAALSSVGIKTNLKGYPSGTYFTNFAGSPAYVHSHDLGIDAGGWAADWPDLFGWFDEIENGNAIASAGNTNISETNDPVINNALAQAESASSTPALRASLGNKIDQQVMSDAVMLPIVYAKSLLYRPSDLTNVFVQAYYGMYNYSTLGLKS
jgi:peptide/nickel transport system substrate-binding protein